MTEKETIRASKFLSLVLHAQAVIGLAERKGVLVE